jgi:hypothetical protein
MNCYVPALVLIAALLIPVVGYILGRWGSA